LPQRASNALSHPKERIMQGPDAARPKALDALDDAELVRLACAHDADAFRTIMQRNNRRLYRIARSVMHDDGEAEDVVQEAYVRAFANLDQFRGDASLSTWLTRIALNEALGRKRWRRPTVGLSALDTEFIGNAQIIPFPLMPGNIDPEREAAQRQIRDLIEGAVDRLPEIFRVVFVMREIEDMSIEETAEILRIRPATVKTRLHRARRMLRQALDEQLASTLTGAFPFEGRRCKQVTDAVLERLQLQMQKG
jgi:RNA polymerase sigma-70 factor (ECF subfamily)